jgi:hypothetical protein
MTQKPTGGPAFPGPSFTQNGYPNGHAMGMTLRDWFAGQALCSVPLQHWNVETLGDDEVIRRWAVCAYAVADAMLAAREASE